MSLDFWLTSLKRDVSDVSAVQPSIHAGYSRYGTETAAVSDVSAEVATMRTDTADTAAKMQAYQRKPAPVLACTPDTADTAEKINTGANAANDPQADPDRHCYPHTEACNSAELETMATRLERFARLGLAVDQAERQADKLLIRDQERDDRRTCLECASLSGDPSAWRCRVFRQRGARDPGLPADYVGMLQRCPTFQSARMAGQ